jgi:SAM-dependent methyltransferase
MLEVAVERLEKLNMENWRVTACDHRYLPLEENSVDLIVSGWSFCYLAVWEGDDWEQELNKGILEANRVLRRGGMMIVIETLGTGNKQPEELDKLSPYLRYLEDRGFQRSWIRTDYRFNNWDEAHELVEFFFGEEMVEKIGKQNSPILPECTGIWWKKYRL